ncbi:hypothetical protein [Actinokineospora inagensis]|uniref:hypothetical protein n=1 Tax=Actinokineospora inagensis TaxID=103730 RepID=UPI0003F9BEED|nr:hypothetical protein [Actinokineospora inagensis]
MSELEHPADTGALVAGLERFENALLANIEAVGLPTNGVLVEMTQRRRVLANLDGALDRLGDAERARSYYISKMIAVAAAGLFDAALNYLWDETIAELRRRVADYDLSYFFDVAVPAPEKRKHLSNAHDLALVQDIDLLRAARDIGLLSDIGHAQLDGVRYMRNHASAAHPNQAEISGLQLVTWLETCILQVITLPLDTVTAETGKLLRNIKQQRLSADEVAATSAFFDQLPGDRAHALAAGLFGIYTNPSTTPDIADNVRTLWPELWPYMSDDTRYGFGVRIGRFVANADLAQSARGRQLFDLVDGASYLPEPVRAAEIDMALGALLEAHHGWNNFSTEPGPARQLEALVGDLGLVPLPVSTKYAKALVEVFLSNGSGVSWEADPIYRRLLERLDTRQARLALRAFTDQTISSRLQTTVAQGKWQELLTLLEPKLTRREDRDLFDAVREFPGRPHELRSNVRIMQMANPPQVRPKP